jgi:hypothetical protein
MKNGRENRNHGNQEKGKEEKEALREVSVKQQTGDAEASPKFFLAEGSTLSHVVILSGAEVSAFHRLSS